MIRWAIVVFPGSLCEEDCFFVLKDILSQKVEYIFHTEKNIKKIKRFNCIILPGGFSFGDYLRAGAIAALSPVMHYIEEYIQEGGLVIGICNGFQILLERKIIEGAMLRNKSLKFICKNVFLKVIDNTTPFTINYYKGEIISMPIAHMEGNYYVDKQGLERMIKENRIIFQYCDKKGDIKDETNPNGSVFNIAGIVNKTKNVIGMMPHPERACLKGLGSKDGLKIFTSVIKYFS